MSLRLALSTGAICVALVSCTPVPLPTSVPESVPSIPVAEMCTAARADGRMNELNQSQCTCFYGYARDLIDQDVSDRLIFALYSGRSQSDYLDQLPPERQARASEQMRALVNKAPSCGIDALPG